MTKSRDHDLELARLEEELVDDIVSLSDEDLLAEAKKDGVDVAEVANRGREIVSKAIAAAGKAKLVAAQIAVKASHERAPLRVIQGSLQEKQRLIQAVIAKQSEGSAKFTLAARNAGQVTENDVDQFLQDLMDLGLLGEDGQPE